MKLPSDFDIFSPPTLTIPLCIQWRANVARALGLGALVLVVREDEVVAAAVQVEALAEEVERHRRALDVPTRPARRPTASPTRARRLRGLPEREVHGLRFGLVDVDARACRLAEVVEACGAAARRSPGTCRPSKYTPSVDHVRVAAVDQLADRGGSSGRCSRSRVANRRAATPRRPCGRTRLARTRPRAPARGAALGGPGDDLVVDVGDVAHEGDVETRPLEVAADTSKTTAVRPWPTCGDVVDGRAADVDRQLARARGGRAPPCRAATCRGSGRPWRPRVVRRFLRISGRYRGMRRGG